MRARRNGRTDVRNGGEDGGSRRPRGSASLHPKCAAFCRRLPPSSLLGPSDAKRLLSQAAVKPPPRGTGQCAAFLLEPPSAHCRAERCARYEGLTSARNGPVTCQDAPETVISSWSD